MKKRILSILLLCCMVLTLLPTAAFAAGKIWVGTEKELLAALADKTIDRIGVTSDITVSQTLVIDRQVVLVLDHSLKIDREQSSSGTLFHITKSGYLDTNAGSITDNVLNEGKFFPRQISGEVINEGEIIRGSFSGKVKNRGSINYGSFRGEVENAPGGKIANGELYGEVTNHGEISGREFYGKVTNDTDGLITSGEFYGEVVNNGRITGGEFYGDVVNNGTITGGSFFGTLTGSEIQGDLYRTVTFDSDGGSAVTPQPVLRGQKAQRPADPTKDGYTFIGWYNKADLQYINLPEWNFDYPVFENLELVAQWMEARPISTDPITYLDKDGNQQVCTAYTVLTSETKESILNYADKWYDLPAGWYVVEGNVTITPRLDTHGEVNLILTNGSHLTAEWGIDVKVGDTFTVYAQSTDEGTMGRLTACLPADFNLDRMVHYSVWPDSGMAGIGSSARWREGNDGIRESEGTIVINGGNIRARGQDKASAIGGTCAEEIEFRSTDRGEVYNRRQGGSITINGGVVRTEPFALLEGNPLAVISVGIGTCHYGYGGSVTINGGTVIAEAANDAITTGDGGTITINGGDVTARGGVNNFGENSHRVLSGNGIGPLINGSITINSGTVKATAKGNGFGIGGSRFEIIGTATVTINGGTIEATANHNNAAIGDKGIGKSGVTINDGIIHAVGKGSAAGIGSKGDIRITGGKLTVSAEGSGAAIGGFTDSYSGRVDCKSITINGDVIQSISSKDGACIGGAAGGSVGSIAISNAELSSLSAEKILIGWGADSPGGKLTIRNCRVASTDTLSALTDGIRVGSNSEIVIEESEIRLPHLRGIRVGGNGSIAVRDSDLHTYGIFMDETVHTITDAKTLKKLEITDSSVLTGDIIGARGEYSSVEEIVIRGSSIRLNDKYTYNYCTIGGGTKGSFGSIDIQDSQIDITSSLNAPIGSGLRSSTDRESRIRIANSQVSVRNLKFGPAIGSGYTSHGGRMDIIIENSTVTAKGGSLRSDSDYIPGIGKNASGCKTVIGIQILNSTVDSFRLEEKDGTNYVYDDLHTKELPGIPAENISICGSTVNGTPIDHSFDEYGKCTLCGKYDLGYCYEHGLLTMEGLTGCVSDGSEKKLTGLSHKTGENETKQLAENTDYTASYSNNVHPYTLTPDDAGFDPAKAPKVTLYGTGNYCGKAEHYFTISENTAAAPSITTSSLPDGKVGEAYSQTLTATGTKPITWSIENGDLPAGLSLNKDTGKINGTPTAAGTASFTVKAANSAGSDTKELSITIEAVDPVELDPVPYLDADGKRQVCTEYTVLKSNTTNSILDLENKWYELPAGWYVVEGDVTITPRVDTQGEVNLILKDGSHLTAEWGINVKKGDTFTVYAQSTGEDTMGKLTACLPEDFNSDGSVDYVVWPDEGLSGIGGGVRWKKANNGIYESEGTIVINGGNIRARGQNRASAIGGTFQDHADVASSGYSSEKRLGGSITINGGIVRTEAITSGTAITAFNVGIGSCCSGYGGSVTINGGTVIANAASSAISTGRDGSITINGGTITATGGINNFTVGKDALILGNGIGPYWTGTVTVNGGKIKASTAGQGSGIGGSRSQTKVIINGGDIEAVADQYGTGQNGAESISTAGIGGVGSVSITGGRISATAIGGAAGIGGNAEISITGGEITVSATGTGAAIGGAAGKDCKSIHIQGDVLKSVSSVNGACIGAANGKGSGNITIANVKLSSLSGKNTLIGWEADSPESQLTIRNCRILSTDADTSSSTNGICVGKSSSILIEDSEIKLPQKSCIRADDGGSIVIRDSTIHSHGIYMRGDKNAEKKLKRLEITDSTVVTGDVIGGKGDSSSVDEIVIRSSNISLDSRDIYNRYSIGCGTNGSFGSIDIQNSTIDIPRGSDSAAIGSALGGNFTGESLIRIADSHVTVACLRRSPAIGAGVSSYGNGKLKIYIENSNVTAKGGSPKADDQYIPGIGRHGSADKPEVYIQILNSTVESFRHTKTGVEDDSDLVHDDLHIKELPGIPPENITICGSTVNKTRIDHSPDEYGKCALCGKYDIGYCYENELLTMEGLTDCVSDGSEKKLTGLSHQTGENETKQLAENTDYTASYSNNVAPYTLTPEDEGFDPAKAPKVTLYGTGNYCGKAEHYFTISENAAAAPSITTSSLPDGKVGEAYSHTLTATGTAPITWSIDGGLPADLNLNANTGEISGTPTADGTAKFTVKAENSVGSDTKELSITITKDAPAEFTISVKTDGNGTASASPAKAVAGAEITLTAKPDEGYRFKEWQVISGGVTIVDDKFIMPDSNVEVKAIFEEDEPPAPTDPAKPNISVTGTYTYNGSVHTATVNGYDPATMDISGNTATDAGDYTVRVTSKTGKWADGSTDAVTAAWSISKATQEAPSGLTGVEPSTEDGSDGKITGVTDKMEYRMEAEGSYTPCSGTEIENLSAGNYFVRYAGDHNHFASPDAEVTVGEGKPLADFTITFNGNGGSGSMEPVTVKAGTNYILPACGFTAPADQEFKAWEISGAEYKVGDSYTVDRDTEIKALWENSVITPTTYTVTVSNDGNGTGTATPSTAAAGTMISLTATPNEGYHFKEWQVISGGVTIKNNKFIMPSANVEVKAIFEEDVPAPTEFIVTFDGNGGTPSVGSMTTTNQKLPSLPSASRSGSYSFDGWYTKKSGGTKITTDTVFHADTAVYAHWTYIGGGGGYNPPVTYYTLRFETGGGSDIPRVREAYNAYIDLTGYVPTWRGHTFIGWYSERSLMNKVSGVYLTKDMTVYAGWRVDENPGTGANPFTDVSEKDWFYGDVMFVYENGLMLGTSKTLFSPHGTATRGMMATILWRMEGSPAPKGKNSFTDVEAGKWYADAITWTAENGIFAGYGKDKFGPDDPITREQLAAIFYRYADYKGYDLTVKGNLDKFKDADKITDYAKTAMQWAVGSGLVKGKSGNLLDPQGTATRAEIAAMLHRFIEKYELVQGKAPGGLMGWIDPKRLQIPKTGDSSVLGLWGISLCTSLAGCLALTTWQIRRRREEEALQIIEK